MGDCAGVWERGCVGWGRAGWSAKWRSVRRLNTSRDGRIFLGVGTANPRKGRIAAHPQYHYSRRLAAWRTERELEAQRVVYIRSDLYPDGEFVPELEARLSVFDRGYTIGDSVYEYGRTYRHSPFQVEEHMDRMFTRFRRLRINPGVTREPFCALCKEVTIRGSWTMKRLCRASDM